MITATGKRISGVLLSALAPFLFFAPGIAFAQQSRAPVHRAAPTARLHRNYLGFDTNIYPGDALLPKLHKHFAYLGYWLNVPPGASQNQWIGKRAAVLHAGFGFLILFNGRLDKELRRTDAAALGTLDGADAAHAAKGQGFPPNAIIFLDLEEGGRMLPEQLAYIGAWIHAVRALGYRAGVYCSGMESRDSSGVISTAEDVAAHFPGTAIWAANDRCPPAPGCVARALRPSQSGFHDALVWQFSQSPRRRKFTRACVETYARDGNCYAPGLPHNQHTALDLDTSTKPDPSAGR